jgi:adenylate kinase family enzyme
MFDLAMQKMNREFVVFELVISEQEAIKRLAARNICPACGATYSTLIHGDITHCPLDNTLLQIRDDDKSIEAITERFKLFHYDTRPGLEEYKTE